MTKTIKELAKELNCSYEAVRKQVKRYSKELQDHIFKQHKTQYLDDYACDFLRDKRMDSPVVVARIEYDEAVEKLKVKYTELLEEHTALQKENNRLISDKNEQIALLQADNEAAKGEVAKAAQEAKEALQRALRAKEREEAWKKYAADLEAYDARPWWRRRKADRPVAPVLQED